MRILFVCRFLPHPGAHDAAGQGAYHYIASLAERHDVSLIAFATRGQEAAVAAMRALCEEVVAVPYSPHGLLPRLWRLGWRVLLTRVYGRNVSLRYRRALSLLLDRACFDIAIFDGMMARYGCLIRGPRRILDEIDVYAMLAYQKYRNRRHGPARLWDRWDWLRTLSLELHTAASYDGILVRSEKDRAFLAGLLPECPIFVLPPWFEGLDSLREIEPLRPEGNRLLYVGAMAHPENIEAVIYFVHEVLPLVRRRVPSAELYIVGGAPAPAVRRLVAGGGVVVSGAVEELRPYYERCAVNVVPLLRGGGVIVKTLNGLAAARPTVATVAGVSGIGAQPGRDLVVANDAAAFAEAVVALLLDRRLWRRVAVSGRRYILDNYRWEGAVRALEEALWEVAAR